MHPETIPEDIYSLLDDDNHHIANEENIQFFGEAFKAMLRDRLTKREVKSGEDVLRFSSIGKPDRQLWMLANKSETLEKMGGKQNFKFLYGDCIELLLLFLAAEAGHKVERAQEELEVDGVKGHIDAVIDGVLVDSKSASRFAYPKFADGTYIFDDPFGYVPQLSAYAHAAEIDKAGFLVACKDTGDICYAPLDAAYLKGNTPASRIEHLRGVIGQDTPPPKCYEDVPEGKSGNRRLGVGCSYCAAKDECWSDANGGKGLRKFYYSGGPKWLTKVVKEPKVGEA
jgi:hypothetical protein